MEYNLTIPEGFAAEILELQQDTGFSNRLSSQLARTFPSKSYKAKFFVLNAFFNARSILSRPVLLNGFFFDFLGFLNGVGRWCELSACGKIKINFGAV
jgi:hypothetical protein